MSGAVEHDPTPIESREQLLDFFRDGIKDPDQRGVGTEHEKFVFRRDDCRMVSHGEEGGLQDIFLGLADTFGLEPVYEKENIIAMRDGEAGISLEPGGQFELSGAVQTTIPAVAAEYDRHIDQLREVAGDDVMMTIWGLNPFVQPADVPLVPKQRYDIMRSYLPARGELAPWMMKATCTVQANFDYTGEEDAADLMRTALLISPIVSAIFSNSSVKQCQDAGMQSYRGYLWTRTDPDRCGWPEFMYRDDWGFEDYLEYVMDVPMFFIERGGRHIPKTGQTFRQFLDGGHGRWTPRVEDFELHLSTLFPEVRLKKFIEVRGADGGPRSHVAGVPALWKGLVYHGPSRRAARELLAGMEPAQHRQLFMDCYRDGFEAQTPHGSVAELAEELLRLSEEGLRALQPEGVDEVSYLEPLRRIVEQRRTLADELLEDFEHYDGNPRPIIEKWNVLGG